MKTLWKCVPSLAGTVAVENHLFCSLCLMQNGDSAVSWCECGSLRAKADDSTNIFTDNIKKQSEAHISSKTPARIKNKRVNVFTVNLFPLLHYFAFVIKDHIILFSASCQELHPHYFSNTFNWFWPTELRSWKAAVRKKWLTWVR